MNPGELFGALTGIPALPGARCIGRWDLFDPRGDDESTTSWHRRRDLALAVCRDCPALGPCEQWAASLKPSKRPAGVIAGAA